MPANIDSLFYYGEVPWHGLGTKLDHPATSREAIQAAGLDWPVEMTPIFIRGTQQTEFRAVLREGRQQAFAVLGNRYTPIQNRDAFGFFDDVVGEGKAIYHTAGALGEGETIWILAKLPGSLDIAGDEVEKFILLVNSHNGSTALRMFHTPIRVVCQNTLRIAMARVKESFYARHTPGLAAKCDAAKEILGLTDTWYADFEEKARHLATIPLLAPPTPMLVTPMLALPPGPTMEGLIRHSFGIKEDILMEDLYKPQREALEKVPILAEMGRGMRDNPDIRGTRWAAYNAVVEYVDYCRVPKGENKDSKRLNSVWFGNGAAIKQAAWDYLLRE